MNVAPTLVVFQLDLRLLDHPALAEAVHRGGPIIPVFLWAPEEEKPWAPGAASRWWLHHSLEALETALRQKGSRLIYRSGSSLTQIKALVHETGAKRVFWNKRYEPACRKREEQWHKVLRAAGVLTESFDGNLLFSPEKVRTKTGKPYQVFTPFWRRCGDEIVGPLLAGPKKIPSPSRWPKSEMLPSWKLLPRLDWADGFSKIWEPGLVGAQKALARFNSKKVAQYGRGRDVPAEAGTSRFSPHLHFGELSPREIWHHIRGTGAERFLREIGWREFAYHLLIHFPHTPESALHSKFNFFRWSTDGRALKAWQRARTGYPLIDAGLRELWATGWMHNRVRMVVGSFLVKDLRISWEKGARWFWDTLVDADLANNTLGWQWVAGCGADAAPYFRVFNPVLQQKKFDPQKRYIKKWIPEFGSSNYGPPIVDHNQSRADALLRYSELKDRS